MNDGTGAGIAKQVEPPLAQIPVVTLPVTGKAVPATLSA